VIRYAPGVPLFVTMRGEPPDPPWPTIRCTLVNRVTVSTMTNDLDPAIAERIVSSTLHRLPAPPGNKILCTKAELRAAFMQGAREGYQIGILRGQQERFGEITRPGSPTRPAWTDIPLDSHAELAKNGIHLRPVVLKCANRPDTTAFAISGVSAPSSSACTMLA
jgi:hypothetical protein